MFAQMLHDRLHARVRLFVAEVRSRVEAGQVRFGRESAGACWHQPYWRAASSDVLVASMPSISAFGYVLALLAFL